MKAIKSEFVKFLKRYWDEGLVYISAFIGVFVGQLKMAEDAGASFKPSTMSIIVAVFVSIAVTWFIENRGMGKAKDSGALQSMLDGRKKNLPIRAFIAWILGIVGQVALPQVVDAVVAVIVGFVKGFGG